MQTVVETPTYLRSAKIAGVSEIEQVKIIDTISANPLSGDLIVGGKGLRKIRVAGLGKGKSGGFRVIYYFHNENKPIKLYYVFAKNQMSNLSDAQLARLSSIIED